MVRTFFTYFLAPILSLLLFILLFKVWNIDLTVPFFGYDSDVFMSAFEVKNILQTGWLISNDKVGLPSFGQEFSFYDFPVYVEFFSTLLIKFLGVFSSNHFVVTNLFFVLTIMLVSLASFIVLRHFKVSVITSCVISILYAFLPYHFVRGTCHLLLSNYLVAPFIVMISLWIIEDKIRIFDYKNDKPDQIHIYPNLKFIVAFILSLFIAIGGLYYAFYACLLFILSWFLRGLKKDRFFDKDGVSAIFLAATIFAIIAAFHIPSLIYWIKHGNSKAFARMPEDSEFFALRILDLFLPIKDHIIKYFSDINNTANLYLWNGNASERRTESLGFIGSVAFLSLLLWVIVRDIGEKNIIFQKTIKRFSLIKDDKNLISNLANLNILSVLFVTAGGFIMFFALFFPYIRSHARFVVFIAFVSLFFAAIIFDKIIEKKLFGKKIYAQILIIVIGMVGLFDQLGNSSARNLHPKDMLSSFNSDRDFFNRVENQIAPNSKIFILPVLSFPENGDYTSLAAYLHTKNLVLSYPLITGRKSHIWQIKVWQLNEKQFVKEIKKQGFSGVVINFRSYYNYFNFWVGYKAEQKRMVKLETYLRSISKKGVLISRDSRFGFFEI